MPSCVDLGLFAERKVLVITGKVTKYVSLPKVWCDAHKVEKGDVLEIYLDDDSRLVITKKP